MNGLYVILGNDSENDDFMYYYDNNGTIRGEISIIDIEAIVYYLTMIKCTSVSPV